MLIETHGETGKRIQGGHAAFAAAGLQPSEPAFKAGALRQLQAGETSGAETKLERGLALCPQGADCGEDGAPTRIFECEQGCGFRGCAACMKVHEDEPHSSDADNMAAMVREVGGCW